MFASVKGKQQKQIRQLQSQEQCIDHIPTTFRNCPADCRVHSFSDNPSRNSCILRVNNGTRRSLEIHYFSRVRTTFIFSLTKQEKFTFQRSINLLLLLYLWLPTIEETFSLFLKNNEILFLYHEEITHNTRNIKHISNTIQVCIKYRLKYKITLESNISQIALPR